eukprot:TRINITY_DN92771_c0_g1_i1.p1 TRINITY_DN92771_c0_g1~~TRINITY_DN92771_c0_g1_i1.p1  ORF type:complete len:711 (+),score=134.15 TRINITY_DN92771_c0_g1_i1:80-2212(+)
MVQVSPSPPEPPEKSPRPLGKYPNDDELSDDSDAGWLESALEKHAQRLLHARPHLAVLVDNSDPHAVSSALDKFDMHDVEVSVQTNLTYFRQPQTLLVLRSKTASKTAAPCKQLLKLRNHVQDSVPASDLTMVWPLHDHEVLMSIYAMQAAVLIGVDVSQLGSNSEMGRVRYCIRALFMGLRFYIKPWSGFLKVLQRQYGPAVAYVFARNLFFTQKLWLLAVWCVVFMCVMGYLPEDSREFVILRTVMQCGIVLWGGIVAFTGRSRSSILPRMSSCNRGTLMDRSLVKNPSYKEKGRTARLLQLFFVALPLNIFYLFFVVFTLVLLCQLLVHVIFVWGRCLEKFKEGAEMCGADTVHGFEGFIAGLGSDILIATIFAIHAELAKTMSFWVSSLRNQKLLFHSQLSQESLFLCINVVERLGLIGALAFMFTPQWVKPASSEQVDCSNYIFGESNVLCLQEQLPVEHRRHFLRALVRGAFVVAPFIEILMKTLVPVLAMWIDRCARRVKCCCVHCDCFLDGLAHLIGLIFFFDCPKVGCICYLWQGWPFRNMEEPVCLKHGDEEKAVAADIAVDSVRQSVRREFEAIGELKEIKLQFMWIMFFGVLEPSGVLTSLAARALESQFDLIKLLSASRRPFPDPDLLVHATQVRFNKCCVVGAFFWNVGLALTAFNDDLMYWSATAQYVFLVGLLVSFVLCMAGLFLPYKPRELKS